MATGAAMTSGCSRGQRFVYIQTQEPLSTVDIKACRERTPKRTCPKSAAKRIRYPQATRPRTVTSPASACLAKIIAMLKRFKIIADRYRNRRRRFGLRFFLIAAIYNKELQLP